MRNCSSLADALTNCCALPAVGASATAADRHNAIGQASLGLIPGFDTRSCLNDAAQNVGHLLNSDRKYLPRVHAPRHQRRAKLARRLDPRAVFDRVNLTARNPQPPREEEVQNECDGNCRLPLPELEVPADDVERK